jgi:hypothetical protein
MPPRGDPGARGGRGGRGRGGAGAPRGGPPFRGGPPGAARATPSAPPSGALPGAHVQAVGVRRSGYGTAGKPINVLTNFFAMTSPESNIHHYDGGSRGLSAVRLTVLINATLLLVGGGKYQLVSSSSADPSSRADHR